MKHPLVTIGPPRGEPVDTTFAGQVTERQAVR
jgi:hypothetical protein